jgi:hypothetical protein
MKRLCFTVTLFALFALFALAAAGTALADIKISDQDYVRHDGLVGYAADPAIGACGDDASPTAGGNRQQNEPTAAVSPSVNPTTGKRNMTAGANDYCTVAAPFANTWAGFYYSSDGGANWTNSLLPGYPGDTSTEGTQSPLQGLVNGAGDPVQAWDRFGHVYYGGIAFNRQRPASGSIWVARYDWQAGPTPDYRFTTLVERGTPSPLFLGVFNDKIGLEVDRSTSQYSGNVYVCWARFTASGPNNGVFFSRSTDGGVTFSNKTKISESVHGSQFCDIAVTKNGTVFVAWRQFAFKPNQGQKQTDAVAFAKSTNGGASFTKPAIAKTFIPWDLTDQTGSPAAYGEAKYRSCLAGDGTLGGCASPEPRATARDCGDGPFVCQSGYVFLRADSQVHITADPTASGNASEAFVVFEATVPGTQTPTGTTYGTLGSGTGSQASVYFIKTSNGGTSWTNPERIDPRGKGHQFFPDIDASFGNLHAVYHDSFDDCATGPTGTAADFRTVPMSNTWVASNPPGGVSCGAGLASRYATSSDGGASWTATTVSGALQMPEYEMFGNRDIPFHGDYNYVSSWNSTVLLNWTDTRDVVPGDDPRYTNGDGTDGFDVKQCRPADNLFGADTCPNEGGLNQNIYGFVLP